MPKLKNTLPSYRRHSTSDIAFVQIQGKRTYLPGRFNSPESRAEYRRLISLWVAEDRPTTPTPPATEITVVELVARYWPHVQKHYLKNGEQTAEVACIRAALRPLVELFGPTPAAEFGPAKLKAVRQTMVASGLARSTINSNVSRIRRLFRWASAEELLSASVWQSLASLQGLQRGRTEARESAPVGPVEDKVVEATLPHLPRIVRDMVRLQQLTGGRPGEVCRLRAGDIDQTGDVWRAVLSDHKNAHRDQSRVLFFGPRAQAILAPYLDRGPTAFCFSPAEAEDERRRAAHAKRRTPMGYGNSPGTHRARRPRRTPGERYDTDSYRRAIERGCVRAFRMPERLRVIPPTATDRDERRKQASEWRAENVWHPNQLRHAAATKVRAEFGLEAAGAVLGHAGLEVTQVYAEKSEKTAERIALQLG